MKLTGNLKKQVEKAETKDEKKSLIENAGMLLNEDELEMVSGGAGGRKTCTLYCAGTVFGSRTVQPSCGYELKFESEQLAMLAFNLKFNKRCPNCNQPLNIR